MNKQFRIKQFSELTSVTVRTLQYYDKIDLLKPSTRTASAHRLYSEDDMLKLEQITSLKFFGFTLKQIQALFAKNTLDRQKTLVLQSEMLAERADQINHAIRLNQQAVEMLSKNQPVDWNIIAKLIEVLQMKQPDGKTWAKKLFNRDELEQFKQLKDQFTPEQVEIYQQRWGEMFEEVKQNLQTDPNGDIGQRLAAKWLSLVDQAYGPFPEIREKLWSAFKAGSAPKEMSYFDQEVIDYIAKASEHYYKEK